MSFKLDTSGVILIDPTDIEEGYWLWEDLSPFAQGYVEAMPWHELRRTYEFKDTVRDHQPGFSDLAPETLQRIIEDCEWLQSFSETKFDEAAGRQWWSDIQAGKELIEPITVYLGDDGKVRFK